MDGYPCDFMSSFSLSYLIAKEIWHDIENSRALEAKTENND